MFFINNGEPFKLRIGSSAECYWKTIKTNEIIDLSQTQGKALGLTPETTKGKIGNQIVETKQISVPDSNLKEFEKEHDFFKELQSINGIGKKTAEDVLKIFKTKEELIKHIKADDSLPIRDDIEEKLRRLYG